jgi:hypothetical protein
MNDVAGRRSPRIALAALLALALLGCQRPPPPQERPPAPPEPPQHVEILPARPGAVDALVKAAATRAQQDGRRLLVYVSAGWCEPCERFQKAVRAGALDATFPDLRLLMFDQDRDLQRLAAAGYDGRLIPRFVVPGPDGRGTTRRVEGGTKAEDTVATSIVPRLARLLGGAPPQINPRPGGPQ